MNLKRIAKRLRNQKRKAEYSEKLKKDQHDQSLLTNVAGYRRASRSEIMKNGARYLAPVRLFFKYAKVEDIHSRTIGFSESPRTANGDIMINCVVGGYRLEFVPQNKSFNLYLLTVNDLATNSRYKSTNVVADHLWINAQDLIKHGTNNLDIGVGDVILIKGHPSYYHGELHNHPILKASLDNIRLLYDGYPVLGRDRSMNGIQLYNHRNMYLLGSRKRENGRLMFRFGDEFQPSEKRSLNLYMIRRYYNRLNDRAVCLYIDGLMSKDSSELGLYLADTLNKRKSRVIMLDRGEVPKKSLNTSLKYIGSIDNFHRFNLKKAIRAIYDKIRILKADK